MNKGKQEVFDVVGALIADKKKKKMLLCKRMENDRFGSMWEFPGGKVEMHEDKKEAIKREIMEELGIAIKVGRLVNRFEDEIPEMRIYVYLYECTILSGQPQCLECQELRWVTIKEATALDLAPADKKIVGYMERRRVL
ncbi:MAG: (deoxy)nucleoside triphosphate pyrophosphohydrolase [Candidatus Omnitrophota bacterium]